MTNNTVISAVEIGTQPSRAKALQKLPKTFADPKMWDKNARAPVDSKAEVLRVPTDHIPSAERRLAYAQDGVGGYKVPSLVGLHVTAPYLHDGGVAAGPQAVEWTEDEGYIPRIREELGLTGTVLKGRSPDVENSLAALVDRGIRREVVRNNRASDRLATSNVTGAGHAYWVDSEAGFTPEEQKALVEYLMSLDGS